MSAKCNGEKANNKHDGTTTSQNDNKDSNNSHAIHMTLPLFLLGVLAPSFLAYGGGLLVSFYLNTSPTSMNTSPFVSNITQDVKLPSLDKEKGKRKPEMPRPFLPKGKIAPDVYYSGKNMVGGHASVRDSHDVHIIFDNGEKDEKTSTTTASSEEKCSAEENDGEDEEHLPAGQHLLVDIEGVSAAFLDDEAALAKSMVDVASASGLTLLSYHCHSLTPKGVSCVGVLLESHISFHTWPDEGVITLDLFTCGSGELVPVLPLIEEKFSIKREKVKGKEEKPKMVWSHVLRGFRPSPEDGKKRILESEIANAVLRRLDLDVKKEVASITTNYQKVDIFDVAGVLTNERSLRQPIKKEERQTHQTSLNRMFFLDGFLQSTSHGDAAYHEALVHPAMFAHANPRQIAILGGGDGAVLREVLKHNTVKDVKLFDIDEEMVNAAREFLPQWNDCSDFKIRADCCFDDDTTEILYEDAMTWFINKKDTIKEEEEKAATNQFDVIIMNAINMKNSYEFAKVESNIESFSQSVYDSLTSEGVLAMQLGFSPSILDPAEEMSRNRNRAKMMGILEQMGFESVHIYEESHGGLHKPSSFLVACKSSKCRRYWHSSDAMMQVRSHNRIVRTHSGDFPLKHFDDATMKTYQIPSKSWETMFCRQNLTFRQCQDYRGYNPTMKNIDVNNFEVKTSSLGEGAGRGLFAKVDISKGSFIGLEEVANKIYFSHETTELMDRYYERADHVADELSKVMNYMRGYGFQSKLVAEHGFFVDGGILTFVNHGCNGTNNIGNGDFSEGTIDTQKHAIPTLGMNSSSFNPVVERHFSHIAAGFLVAQRDIGAGEEIFENYLSFVSDEYEWDNTVQEPKAHCVGEKVGLVKEVGESVRVGSSR